MNNYFWGPEVVPDEPGWPAGPAWLAGLPWLAWLASHLAGARKVVGGSGPTPAMAKWFPGGVPTSRFQILRFRDFRFRDCATSDSAISRFHNRDSAIPDFAISFSQFLDSIFAIPQFHFRDSAISFSRILEFIFAIPRFHFRDSRFHVRNSAVSFSRILDFIFTNSQFLDFICAIA